jgi:hypothetical protein
MGEARALPAVQQANVHNYRDGLEAAARDFSRASQPYPPPPQQQQQQSSHVLQARNLPSPPAVSLSKHQARVLCIVCFS